MSRLLAAKSAGALRVSSWQAAGWALVIGVMVLCACYWRTIGSLIWVWSHDGTYQYAFLIFPLSLWTAFNLRHELLAKTPNPCVWGLLIVASLSFIWLVGRLVSINVVQHFALVAMFPALVLSFWGTRAVRVLMFPLGYLIFAIPFGDSLVGPLQDFTAHFSVRALELIGTPVLLNGREITTPSAVWMVADACSGVKFFIACTALGCLYAYLIYTRWWKRIAFVLLAAVVPIVANGLRVFFTILIGDTWGLKYATGTDHLIFGWQFFGTVLVVLLIVGWLFRDPLVTTRPVASNRDRSSPWHGAVWAVAMALLVAAPVFAVWAQSAADVPADNVQLTALDVPGWHGSENPLADWNPSYQGAAAELQVAYRNNVTGAGIEVFNALYLGRPRRGHNLITYGNYVYAPAAATVLSTASRKISSVSGHAIRVRELRLATSHGPRIVWYWYCVNGHCTDSSILVKLMQSFYVLTGGELRSSVWAVSAMENAGGPQVSRMNIAAFVRVLPDIVGQQSQSDRPVPAAAENRP